MGTAAGQKTDSTGVQVGVSLDRLAEKLRLPTAAAGEMRALTEALLGSLNTPIANGDRPFRFSLTLDVQHPEIDVLWNASGSSSEFARRAQHGLQAQRRLHEVFGASSARFDRVTPLFLGEGSQGAFAVLCSAPLWPSTKPHRIMAYLNPQVRGRLNAPALVEEAFARLGFEHAWQAVAAAMSRGAELEEIRYFGVDLAEDEGAPLEVWVRHHDATIEALKAAASVTPDPDAFVEFFLSATGGRASYAETGLSFVAGGGAKAAAATLRLPLVGHLDDRDAVTQARISAALGEPAAALFREVSEAANPGFTTSLSMRSPGRRVACQISEQIAAVAPDPSASSITSAGPVELIVAEYEEQPFSLHPFLQRMERGPVDIQQMWLMFSNVYAGLAQHFPRRLARVILGVEDEHIRSILAEQLYEELGSGDYTRTHRRLFVKLLESLAPWKPAVVTPEMGAPGVNLSDRLESIYFDPHPYAGVGAAIVIELLGKQVDVFIAKQFRRQQTVPMSSLEWLTEHETLELDHADESGELARLIERDEDRSAALRGGHAVHAAGWLFFDDMYRLCFGT